MVFACHSSTRRDVIRDSIVPLDQRVNERWANGIGSSNGMASEIVKCRKSIVCLCVRESKMAISNGNETLGKLNLIKSNPCIASA